MEVLRDLLSYINPFNENFFVYKLIDLLSELLKSLFVPSEDKINEIKDTITSKFNFIDSIKEGINAIQNMLNNIGETPSLESTEISSKYYNGKLTIVDMSWYKPFKPYGDLVITGFSYIMFIWRMYVHLPDTINGIGGNISGLSNSYQKQEGGKEK